MLGGWSNVARGKSFFREGGEDWAIARPGERTALLRQGDKRARHSDLCFQKYAASGGSHTERVPVMGGGKPGAGLKHPGEVARQKIKIIGWSEVDRRDGTIPFRCGKAKSGGSGGDNPEGRNRYIRATTKHGLYLQDDSVFKKRREN